MPWTAILSFVTGRLGIAIVGGLLLLGLWGVDSLRIGRLHAQVSDLTAQVATEHAETLAVGKALSDFHAQVEKDRADANYAALKKQTELQAQIDKLTSTAAAADKARRAASDQLLKVLHDIPKDQQATLSPAVRDALRRVRVAQGVDAAATSSSGADSQPIPASASGVRPNLP